MRRDYPSLNYLIQPITAAKFRTRFWEDRPLLVQRNAAHYYAGLLTLSDVERLLPLLRVAPDSLRIVKNGQPVELASSVNENDAVLAAYQAGATIILQALHKYWPPLTRLCNSLAREFSCPFQVNAYLTPPAVAEARGLGIHYDVHDVFVLQLLGAKRWRLYQAPIRLPLENDSFDPKRSNYGKPRMTFELDPGDCLYIPRGYIHEAMVQGRTSASLHLTIGMKSLTWMHLIQAVVQVAGEHDAKLRMSLPMDFTDDSRRRLLRKTFRTAIERLSTGRYIERAVDAMADDLLHEQRATLDHRLADFEECPSIDLDTTVHGRREIVASLVRRNSQLLLAFQGKQIAMPGRLNATIRFVMDTPSFRVADLPGDLDAASKIVLVRRLVREGFLTLRGPVASSNFTRCDPLCPA